ncbi:MAG: hypothetical protein OEV44_00380 [Spirochaetota bacterium]|nr:hypothetical protein [Spirochaetota bacterium]
MADTKVSQLTETAITSGGYYETSIPDGIGGWLSRKISNSNLFAVVNTYIAQSTQTAKEKNKSTNFTKAFGADVAIDGIDFIWVSGTPSVKVGTAPDGNDIISGRTPTGGNASRNLLSEYFENATTLYFTITSGIIDIIINYRNNYNS